MAVSTSIMSERINIKAIYKGGCLGCRHLHRMNKFSDIWYCDLEYKRGDNGKSWRENGKKMVKCDNYEKYTEERCIDCALAYSSGDVRYWHCRTDCHCFNYTDKACEHFNTSVDEYNKAKERERIVKDIQVLESLKKEYERKIDEIETKIDALRDRL